MTFALTIPTWLLWTLGVVAGIVVLGLAAVGILAIFWFREFKRSWDRAWGWW